ncbi:hypothetical protein Scep_018689 [Stephania cephalantha]|uniref:FDX-ACB domain-containing protein n=1 Tax=Stephania cephalantha TaxID=152367 RepID=A0AAP0I9I9_9MAGN
MFGLQRSALSGTQQIGEADGSKSSDPLKPTTSEWIRIVGEPNQAATEVSSVQEIRVSKGVKLMDLPISMFVGNNPSALGPDPVALPPPQPPDPLLLTFLVDNWSVTKPHPAPPIPPRPPNLFTSKIFFTDPPDLVVLEEGFIDAALAPPPWPPSRSSLHLGKTTYRDGRDIRVDPKLTALFWVIQSVQDLQAVMKMLSANLVEHWDGLMDGVHYEDGLWMISIQLKFKVLTDAFNLLKDTSAMRVINLEVCHHKDLVITILFASVSVMVEVEESSKFDPIFGIVKLIDNFTNKKGMTSHCYRIAYRSMERSLTDEEINQLQWKVREGIESKLKVVLR